MATQDLDRLVVQLSADITKYEKAMNKALGVTSSNVAKMQKTATAGASSIESAFTSLGGKLAAGLGVVEVGKAFLNLSDSATKITNSLKTTGLSGAELTTVMDQLYAVALKNGAPIEALAQLYSRVSVVQKELGVTSQQLVGLTDNVGKSLKITGVSAEEASGTLLQLAQAFGGNKIQAQEYNSLIDGALPLLKAAAAGIKQAGGSVATLTQLVKTGKISNKAFFDGIEAGSYVLDNQLVGSTLTVGQALTNLNTAMTKSVGKFNDASGASVGLANGINEIANAIPNLKFDNLIATINAVTGAVLAAENSVDHLGERLTYWTGINFNYKINAPTLDDIVAATKKSFDAITGTVTGGALTIQDKIDDVNATIKTLGEKGDSGDGSTNDAISVYKDQLVDLNKQLAEAKVGMAGLGRDVPRPQPVHSKTPAAIAKATIAPIDINSAKYIPVGGDGKTKKASKEAEDSFDKQSDSINKATDALTAETAAQAKLNPLVDDYGFAVAKARQESLLKTAAEKASGVITDQQAASIEQLSTAYATATAEANKLDEQQRKLVQTQQEIQSTAKDVSRGIVDGFIQGQKASEIFANALDKIGSKLLDLAFDSAFDSTSKGGLGIGDFVSKLFGFSEGGYTGQGGKNDPAGVVHKGEYVVPKAAVDRVGVSGIEKRLRGYANGGLVGGVPRIQKLPQAGGTSAGDNFTYAPVIDASGADSATVAKLASMLESDRKSFEAKTIATIRKAKNSNVKGI